MDLHEGGMCSLSSFSELSELSACFLVSFMASLGESFGPFLESSLESSACLLLSSFAGFLCSSNPLSEGLSELSAGFLVSLFAGFLEFSDPSFLASSSLSLLLINFFFSLRELEGFHVFLQSEDLFL